MIIDYVIANWEFFLLGFMVLEKIVKLTSWKWDDILIDGIKEIFTGIGKMRGKTITE